MKWTNQGDLVFSGDDEVLPIDPPVIAIFSKEDLSEEEITSSSSSSSSSWSRRTTSSSSRPASYWSSNPSSVAVGIEGKEDVTPTEEVVTWTSDDSSPSEGTISSVDSAVFNMPSASQNGNGGEEEEEEYRAPVVEEFSLDEKMERIQKWINMQPDRLRFAF